MKVKLEVTGRDVTKPSSLAPHGCLQLSLFDLTCPTCYVPMTFFYKSITGESPEIISRRLKTSLSETLSCFYPLAGRIEGTSISFNDEEVVFSKAHTNLLSDFLRNINIDSVEELFPREEGVSPGTWPLLKVNVSFFGSGSGVAVTVGISHRICDAASLLNFVQSWAATAQGEPIDKIMSIPQFVGVTIYPPPKLVPVFFNG